MSKRSERRARKKRQQQEAQTTIDKAKSNPEYSESNGHTAAPRSPIVVESPEHNPVSSPEARDGRHEHHEAPSEKYARGLNRWTAGLVLVGLLTVGVLFLQFCELRETEETARKTNRAYVMSNELIIEPIQKDENIIRWVIYPLIENAGNTSTVNARSLSGLKPWAGNGIAPTEPTGKIEFDPKEARQFTLGPKSKNSKIVAPMHVTPESLPALRSGNPRLFVVGEIQYDDVFDASRITRYCYFLWAYPENVGVRDITYSLCTGRSNCTDNECEEKK